MQTQAGDVFIFVFAEKAKKGKSSNQLKTPQMVPNLDKNGTSTWVKDDYAK
jgi:hypothetical protein